MGQSIKQISWKNQLIFINKNNCESAKESLQFNPDTLRFSIVDCENFIQNKNCNSERIIIIKRTIVHIFKSQTRFQLGEKIQIRNKSQIFVTSKISTLQSDKQ